MKPKPFSPLNHFTVPVATNFSFTVWRRRPHLTDQRHVPAPPHDTIRSGRRAHRGTAERRPPARPHRRALPTCSPGAGRASAVVVGEQAPVVDVLVPRRVASGPKRRCPCRRRTVGVSPWTPVPHESADTCARYRRNAAELGVWSPISESRRAAHQHAKPYVHRP